MLLKYVLIVLFCCGTQMGFCQKATSVNLYSPTANAAKELDSVIAKAAKENKQVLVQIGGNWCVWCIKLHNFIDSNTDLKRKIEMDYVVYKLNFSKENQNDSLMQKFKNPQRFGFPVLLVLDSNGNLLHTQDTGFLEENESYSKKKLYMFVENWTVKAVAGKY
jgi:thiol:disulfide interchange protein